MMTDTTIQTLFGTFQEKELKEIRVCLDEMVECFYKIDNEKNLLKDIVDVTFDKYKIPKKILRKMAKTHFKQSFQEEAAEFNDFEALFEKISEMK
jgi:hypothetical protein